MSANPKRVEAGRKGGKRSSGNFKYNREAARKSGRKSALIRAEKKMKKYAPKLGAE